MSEVRPGHLVLGVGNTDRGDDGVGRAVTKLLRANAAARVLEHDGEATSLLRALEGHQAIWLIDAARSGAPPGTIHRIDCATDAPLPRSPVSSHGLGVAEAIALARALGTLPSRCIVYAIEASDFTSGASLSAAVAGAAREVAARVMAELTLPQPSVPRQPHPVPGTDRR